MMVLKRENIPRVKTERERERREREREDREHRHFVLLTSKASFPFDLHAQHPQVDTSTAIS